MVGMMSQMMVGGSGMEGMKMPAMKMDFGEDNFKSDAPMTGGMAGTPMDSATTDQGIKLSAKLQGNPQVGENAFELTVLDKNGTPVTGAKIMLSVAMTSMDMGTSHPSVKEIGGGKYTAIVNFAMAGPWRVTAMITTSGQTASKEFDFVAK
jgi:hypothetical protein